jgi:hypothetical protein
MRESTMPAPTHYTSSKGPVAIADMNPYHLNNAIKKLARSSPKGEDAELLDALRAEQESRGGPPEDVSA